MALPQELGSRELFHVNLFEHDGDHSSRGNNREGLQWTSHFGHSLYLPNSPVEDAPDTVLAQAWQDRDVAAFHDRARALAASQPGRKSAGEVNAMAKGQSCQWLKMRQGDIVMARQRSRSSGDYVLGVFPSNA